MPTKTLRSVQDALLSASIAMPNATATVNTPYIDLGATQPYPATNSFDARIETTTATGADTKTITAKLQDSADGTTFADIPGSGSYTITASGTSYPASSLQFSLPPSTRRYIRASATGVSSGGNASDGTMTLTLRF